MFMSVQKVFCFKHLLMFLILLCFSINISSQFTSGHFFGTTKNIGNYQIVFAPYPPLPFAGDNSTLLNFSILDKENQNVNNIFASLLIKNKENGSISLLVRINGDPAYSQNPITADFDISTTDPNQIIPTNELILYYLVPALVVIAIIIVYLKRKNKI